MAFQHPSAKMLKKRLKQVKNHRFFSGLLWRLMLSLCTIKKTGIKMN